MCIQFNMIFIRSYNMLISFMNLVLCFNKKKELYTYLNFHIFLVENLSMTSSKMNNEVISFSMYNKNNYYCFKSAPIC